MAGPAPSARSTIRSASPARTCRAMACAPTSSVTASAMTANAASAIQSGSMLLCTCASSADATLNQAAPPAPSLASASRSTAGMLPAPPSSLSPYQEMPLLVPAASSVFVSAGVNSRSPCGRSVSSCTSSSLNSTSPVILASILTTGRTRAVP